MAEIVQRRRNAELIDWEMFKERQVSQLEETVQHKDPPQVAIDPVCKMQVEIETAQFSYVYQEEIYYFCCAGCQASFASAPTKYVNEQVEG
jgi:YHS domain-containing protein